MGEGKLKQFMYSVAKMVEPVEQTQEPLSVEAPVSAQPTEGHEGTPISQIPLNLSSIEGEFETDLNDLFKTGISFLEKLNDAISEGNSLKPALSSFFEKDKDKGKDYFKIPVPDEDTISKAVSAFGRFIQGLMKV